ncbi:MAG TPA: Uma2 family endonuclease [Desulfuromonadales bacterium]|nr:Uma2 family endonuclease [Desulfuromonadales bacterium]
MPIVQKNSERHWTYADYLGWPDDERWEIIDGVAYALSPAPGRQHQSISFEMARQLGNYLKDKPCRAFAAPFDVRLSDHSSVSDNYVDTVVQPDLFVVCDKNKLDERGCSAAPDLIIEISSPSTGKNDLTVKFDLYQRHGVKEYWIVHPDQQTVMVFKIGEDGTYGKPDRYAAGDKVLVPLFGELVIDLKEVFAE